MEQGVSQLNRMRKIRTSLVILAISLGGIYYSTQIMLEYDPTPQWTYAIAISSVLLLVAGLIMAVLDWLSERDHWNEIIEGRKAKTANLRRQDPNTPREEEAPADATEESNPTPYSSWEDILNE